MGSENPLTSNTRLRVLGLPWRTPEPPQSSKTKSLKWEGMLRFGHVLRDEASASGISLACAGFRISGAGYVCWP